MKKNTSKKGKIVSKKIIAKPAKKVIKKTSLKSKAATSLDKQTMREFGGVAVSRVREFSPKQIKGLREKEMVSQPVFAAYLNISASTIKKWETGEKKPQGASLKLLNIIAKSGLAVVC
jgi:putative transcriptional regulator